jgi:ABC-type multidrug transport system fused ATPase/permease subunit
MDLLLRYLKPLWRLAMLALLLAATNQVFSLLDPYIFRLIIDNYATKFHQYTVYQFIRGVSGLLGMAVGVAFISRVAKNFQDYYRRQAVCRWRGAFPLTALRCLRRPAQRRDAGQIAEGQK